MSTDKNEIQSRFNMRIPTHLHDEIRLVAKAVGTDVTSLVCGMMRSYLVSGSAAQSRMLFGLPMDGKVVPPSITDSMSIPQFIRDENRADFLRAFDAIFPEASRLDSVARKALFKDFITWRVIRCDDYTFAGPGYYGRQPAGMDTVMAGLVKDALRRYSADGL